MTAQRHGRPTRRARPAPPTLRAWRPVVSDRPHRRRRRPLPVPRRASCRSSTSGRSSRASSRWARLPAPDRSAPAPALASPQRSTGPGPRRRWRAPWPACMAGVGSCRCSSSSASVVDLRAVFLHALAGPVRPADPRPGRRRLLGPDGRRAAARRARPASWPLLPRHRAPSCSSGASGRWWSWACSPACSARRC